jgi:DNA-binding ferritin-like protein
MSDAERREVIVMQDVSASVVALRTKADALARRVQTVVTRMQQESRQSWTSLQTYAETKRTLSSMLSSASQHQRAALDQGRRLAGLRDELAALFTMMDWLDFKIGHERPADLADLARRLGEVNRLIETHLTTAEEADDEDTPDLE